MEEGRKSFVFYKDWAEALKEVPKDVRLEVYDCIIEYALSGKLPGVRKPMAQMAFQFIKGDLDRDALKYEEVKKKKSLAGKKSALIKRQQKQHQSTESTPVESVEQNQHNRTHSTVDVDVNDNVDVNVDVLRERSIAPIPSFENFKSYAFELKKDVDLKSLELKYKAWVENGWRTTGEKPRKIANWKVTLMNTLPHLKTQKNGNTAAKFNTSEFAKLNREANPNWKNL